MCEMLQPTKHYISQIIIEQCDRDEQKQYPGHDGSHGTASESQDSVLLLTAACIHVLVGVKRTAEVGAKCENKALSYLKGRYRDHNRQHRVKEMDCLLCFLYLGITVPQK